MDKELRKTYDTWYQNNRAPILNGQWKLVDKELLSKPESDNLRGLNLISYLPRHINKVIDEQLLPQLTPVISNGEFVIPPNGRHITILDILPHNSGLSTEEVSSQAKEYSDAITESLSGNVVVPLIKLCGIFASPDGITIQGYPANERLAQLRDQLRNAINETGLINLEHKKYKIQTAHVALVKFTDPLDGKKLLEVVDRLRDISLGDFEIGELVLNISPRYDKTETIEIVQKYLLR